METLKGLFNPDRSLPLFLLGTATVTLLLQGIYDYANEPGVWKGGYWLALLMLLMTIGVLIRAWRKRSGRVDIREKQVPRPRRGLILLAGPQKKIQSGGVGSSPESFGALLDYCNTRVRRDGNCLIPGVWQPLGDSLRLRVHRRRRRVRANL